MAEQEQYTNVCKERFDEIMAKLHSLDRKLFKDNGIECVQSKINRHDRWIKGVVAVGAVISTGLFGVALWILKVYLTKGL